MRREQSSSPFAQELKVLHKKFRSLQRNNIRIFFQFCQYDIAKTHKILTIVSQFQNVSSLVKILLEQPEKSEEMLEDFERRYDREYRGEDQLETEDQMEKQVESKQFIKGFDFFKQVPADCVTRTFSYLDPYSFSNLAQTCRAINSISKSEAQSEYYKNLCKTIFKNEEPVLPVPCRFERIRAYVLSKPLEFRPNTRNAVNNNLSYYVWKSETSSFKLEKNYYKSFQSYQGLFTRCPRPNLNGYYICRHRYVRIGRKDEKNTVTPVHIIYYYRYMRFFEDGSVVYAVSNRKVSKEDIVKVLGRDKLTDAGTIVGEYMQYKDKVYVKAAKPNEVFSYEFQLRSTDGKICNEMYVNNYVLELIDDRNEIVQTLHAHHPNKQPLVYVYVHERMVAADNPAIVQACFL